MINGNYLRLIDKIPLFIAACAGFIICLIWFSPNPEPVIEDDKWKEEHKQELENLKTEIEAEFETLKLQYEKDDTVSTIVGVGASNQDFIKRTGHRLPPGS